MEPTSEFVMFTPLLARIDAELARFASLLLPEEDTPDLSVAQWTRWIPALIDDLAELRLHDPVGALRRLTHLTMLASVVGELVVDDAEFAAQQALFAEIDGHYAPFLMALVQGEPADLPRRVLDAVLEEDMVHVDLPPELLAALGSAGREELLVGLLAVSPAWNPINEVVFAKSVLARVLEMVERHGLQDRVDPEQMFNRLLGEAAPISLLAPWLDRVLDRLARQDAESRPDPVTGLAARCEALGRPDLAQQLRRRAFEVLLEPRQLRAWLGHLPLDEQSAAEARALQGVRKHADHDAALLFLVDWPDHAGAVALVREWHGEIIGPGSHGLLHAAELLELQAPDAALLLYRRALHAQLRAGFASMRKDHLLEKCATLWTQYPEGPYESHDAFAAGLERGTAAWFSARGLSPLLVVAPEH